MDEKKIKAKIFEFSKHLKKKDGKKKEKPPIKRQKLIGNNGIQISDVNGDVHIKISKSPTRKRPTKATITIAPPDGSIGSDSQLRQTIQNLFNKIGEARQKRLGKNPYAAMLKKFKSDFGITGKYTDYLLWPQSCASVIIKYLNDKYNNTINGRIEKASKKENYIHTRDHLYRIERELLDHLGIEWKSEKHNSLLKEKFDTDSHRALTHLQHWQLVCYLKDQVEKI